jgi:hypothetical protein
MFAVVSILSKNFSQAIRLTFVNVPDPICAALAARHLFYTFFKNFLCVSPVRIVCVGVAKVIIFSFLPNLFRRFFHSNFSDRYLLIRKHYKSFI